MAFVDYSTAVIKTQSVNREHMLMPKLAYTNTYIAFLRCSVSITWLSNHKSKGPSSQNWWTISDTRKWEI